MHRKHALLRQEVVEDREDRLLQLTGVAGAPDQDRAVRQADDDERPRLGAMHSGVGMEFRSVEHFESRLEAGQIAVAGTQEHVVDE